MHTVETKKQTKWGVIIAALEKVSGSSIASIHASKYGVKRNSAEQTSERNSDRIWATLLRPEFWTKCTLM